jgi:multidrug efflux system outer membrane protein
VLEDVENAFVAHTVAVEQNNSFLQADTAAKQIYRFADALFQRGASDYLPVLDAQRSKLAAADRYAQAETAARVTLSSTYRTFGGGWGIELFQQSVQN